MLGVGGIIVLALFANEWPVDDCMSQFEKLSTLAFQHRKFSGIPFLTKLRALIVSLFTGRLYSARRLEMALKEVFTLEKSILDCAPGDSMNRTRIGITVSSMEPRPYIFTNYNGVGERDHTDYGVLPGSIPLWEM